MDEQVIGDDVEKGSCMFTWSDWVKVWKPQPRQLASAMKIYLRIS
jgi:hypothetical protein